MSANDVPKLAPVHDWDAPNTCIIYVEDGCVHDVANLPPGWGYAVYDYDAEGDEEDENEDSE